MCAVLPRRAFAIMALSCLAGLAHAQTPQSVQAYLAPLKRVSCPQGVEHIEPEVIDLKAARVPLQGVNPTRKTIDELTFVGGYHLTSSDPRFGGLSGLDVLEDGSLLAVSDAGSFVWIELDADGVTPVSTKLSDMRDAVGGAFKRKADADAEGLAVVDGMALVSFEGDPRVAAYDIARCGAAARGAPVVSADLPATFARDGLKVAGNEGAEALAVTPDWYLFAGLETKAGAASPVSARAIEAPPEFDIRIAQGAPELVGLDILAGEGDASGLVAYSLHRSTNPMATNVIVLVETVFARERDQSSVPAHRISDYEWRLHTRLKPVASRVLASMNLFVTIDNFEGVAARKMPDGRVRLYVVADDNFSASQRTLLMVYDIAERD